MTGSKMNKNFKIQNVWVKKNMIGTKHKQYGTT